MVLIFLAFRIGERRIALIAADKGIFIGRNGKEKCFRAIKRKVLFIFEWVRIFCWEENTLYYVTNVVNMSHSFIAFWLIIARLFIYSISSWIFISIEHFPLVVNGMRFAYFHFILTVLFYRCLLRPVTAWEKTNQFYAFTAFSEVHKNSEFAKN